MERIGFLINKLKEQFEQGANPAQMLVTIQMLQNEFGQIYVSGHTLGTSKVAVVLPRSVNSSSQQSYEKTAGPKIEKQTVAEEKEVFYARNNSRKTEQSNL